MIAATCLALAIYYEARSEPVRGQIAVAQVILNAVQWDKEKVCNKIMKGRFIASQPAKRPIPKRKDKAWSVAKKVALKALIKGRAGDITHGADHFDMVNANPYWKSSCRITVIIEGHFFCREFKRKDNTS